jgi:hypothetical protein
LREPPTMAVTSRSLETGVGPLTASRWRVAHPQ